MVIRSQGDQASGRSQVFPIDVASPRPVTVYVSWVGEGDVNVFLRSKGETVATADHVDARPERLTHKGKPIVDELVVVVETGSAAYVAEVYVGKAPKAPRFAPEETEAAPSPEPSTESTPEPSPEPTTESTPEPSPEPTDDATTEPPPEPEETEESPTKVASSPSVDGCLDRPAARQTVTGPQTFTSQFRDGKVPDQHTFDFRTTVFLGDQDTAESPDNPKPIVLGVKEPGADTCVVAGYVTGVHARDLSWEYLKHDPGSGDKPALKVVGAGSTVVSGQRVDNMMNGIRPASDDVLLKNAYYNYVRDDCVENDGLHDMRIVDSLFDGCFTAFSQRPEKGSPLWDAGRDSSVLELDRVLVRMKRMPGGFRITDPNIKTFGHVFKWSKVAGPVVVRDSIFMVEHPGKDDLNDLDWPTNAKAKNVTLVWDGPGDYPGRLPASGVTVTKDTGVWERARSDWLARHGCTGIDTCDPDRLIAPR